MGVHDGHRERLKARFLSAGLNDFEDHNVLELLLFYSIPRSDTNVIAHQLLNTFGSVSAVFDAPVEELCKVKGVSTHTASLIKLIPRLFPIYESDKTKDIEIITSTEDAGRYLMPRFFGKNNEEVHILLLDDKHKILACTKLFEGTINATSITIKKIVAEVMKYNATTVILAHNHPAGVAIPSRNDILTTKKIGQALYLMDVHLKDHIVVSDGDYVSMLESAMLTDKFE